MKQNELQHRSNLRQIHHYLVRISEIFIYGGPFSRVMVTSDDFENGSLEGTLGGRKVKIPILSVIRGGGVKSTSRLQNLTRADGPALSFFDGKDYYDTGHRVNALRQDKEPFVTTHGHHMTYEHLFPRGRLSVTNFANLTHAFFKYFVTPDFFKRGEITDLKIPAKGSSDYTLNGDIYVRRFSGLRLLYELDRNDFFDSMTADFNTVLDFCQHNKNMGPSIVQSLKGDYRDLLDENKLKKEIESRDSLT
jgi:hypothetical protein